MSSPVGPPRETNLRRTADLLTPEPTCASKHIVSAETCLFKIAHFENNSAGKSRAAGGIAHFPDIVGSEWMAAGVRTSEDMAFNLSSCSTGREQI